MKYYFFGKKIMEIRALRRTSQPNCCAIFSPTYSRAMECLGGVVGVGYDGVLPDEVNQLSRRVGDADAIFVETTCRQRPPVDRASTLGVGGRAAEEGRSNYDGWWRIRRRIGTSSWLYVKSKFCLSRITRRRAQ